MSAHQHDWCNRNGKQSGQAMSRKKRKQKFSIATHDIFYAAGFLVLFVGIVVLPLWLFVAALRRPTPPPVIGADGIPVRGGRITDHARVLSPDDLDRLNAEVDAFESATRGQMAILLLSSIGDIRIEDLATRTFHAWGIGHAGRDDGILPPRTTAAASRLVTAGKGHCLTPGPATFSAKWPLTSSHPTIPEPSPSPSGASAKPSSGPMPPPSPPRGSRPSSFPAS